MLVAIRKIRCITIIIISVNTRLILFENRGLTSPARLLSFIVTATYQTTELNFQYPENWKVTEEERVAWPRSVTLESPSGAFWSVHLYPESSNLKQLAADALATMQKEYDSLEHEPVEESLAGFDMSGYDMNFYLLDFVVSAGIRGVQSPTGPIIAFWQAELSEIDEVKPVFLALLIGLLQNS